MLQLALLKLEKDALQGITKVAYVPHLPSLLQNKNTIITEDLVLP